jgi:hypothetical protein
LPGFEWIRKHLNILRPGQDHSGITRNLYRKEFGLFLLRVSFQTLENQIPIHS